VPPPRAEFEHIPRRALIRWAGPWLLIGATAAAASVVIDARLGMVAGAMLLLALFGLLRWRRHAYALDERALFVSSGLLKRQLWTIPFARTQTIHVLGGPLQRRLRLATLLVDTAGASAMRSPEIVDLDSGHAGALAERLLSLFHRARAERGNVAIAEASTAPSW
nr:PH domain-containing protein [Pseudomonadota bacterium]